MREVDFNLKGKRSYVTFLGAAVILLLISLPLRSFKADSSYRSAIIVVDDAETERLDMLVISEETLNKYTSAIALVEKARHCSPLNARYSRYEARLYNIFGVWAETMLFLGEPLPKGALEPSAAFARAEESFLKTVNLEPTNADYHMAFAGLYGTMKNSEGMDKELRRTIAAYPGNAPLRHLVAMLYLLNDMEGNALEHARVLAGMDRGYLPHIIKEGDDALRFTKADIDRFYKSYLFVALEIAWRVSEDKDVVRSIAPDNLYAEEVVELFFDWRGIDDY